MIKRGYLIILLFIILISFSVYGSSVREFLNDYNEFITGKAINIISPRYDFTILVDQTEGNAPLPVHFIIKSNFNIAYCEVDFGDNSFEENFKGECRYFEHTYENPGNYRFILYVKSSDNKFRGIKSVSINVKERIINGYLEIATSKKAYNIGEKIELTDPPAEKKESFLEKLNNFIDKIFGRNMIGSKLETDDFNIINSGVKTGKIDWDNNKFEGDLILTNFNNLQNVILVSGVDNKLNYEADIVEYKKSIIQGEEKKPKPSILITNPLEKDVLRAGDVIEINGSIFTYGFKGYVIEYGVGENPQEWSDEGISLVNNGRIQMINGTLAKWDTSSIIEPNFYTIRITVNGRFKEEVFVKNIYLDPTLKKGWPQKINWDKCPPEKSFCWGGFSDPSVDDLDNDGKSEIIMLLDGIPPKIFVYNENGLLLWQKNVGNANIFVGGNLRPPIIVDINNDGTKEIITHSYSPKNSEIYIFNYNGIILKTLKIPDYYDPALLVSDLNHDGNKELIRKDKKVTITDLLTWNNISEWDFPSKEAWFAPVTPMAVGNFDDDEDLEIAIATPSVYGQESLIYIYNEDGSLTVKPINVNGLIKGLAVGDTNFDGNDDIVVSSSSIPNTKDNVYAFDRNGELLEGWPVLSGYDVYTSPSLADFNNDGYLEVSVMAVNTFYPYDIEDYLINHNGKIISGWPQPIPYISSRSNSIGDINDDEVPDLLIASGSIKTKSGVYAWNLNGDIIKSFPKVTEEISQITPIISDVDNNGRIDIVASSGDVVYPQVKKRSVIYVWELPYNKNQESMTYWPTFNHDNQRTNLYDKKFIPPLPILPKSLINNTGPDSIMGYLLIKTQKEVNGQWMDYKLVLDELNQTVYGTNLRIINPGEYLALDLIFNPYNIRINEAGKYRIYAALRDINGQVIQTVSGKLENYYEFKIVG